MSSPTDDLMGDVLRVLHYLCLSRDLGLRYGASPRRPYGMLDANWAVQHSTMGNVFMMHQAGISWSSRKQEGQCTSLSTCEAEIVAASEAAKYIFPAN
jgi:hypothetical protein